MAKCKCQIKIILVAAEDVFPSERTLTSCANVSSQANVPSLSYSEKLGSPTPFYNASIQADSSTLVSLKLLHRASLSSPAFVDACLLGSIWLRQRGVGSSIEAGGFGQFEWACILAVLIGGRGQGGKPRVSVSDSSLRLFKAMMNFLALEDLASIFGGTEAQDRDSEPIEAANFVIGKGRFNVLFKTMPWAILSIRSEAKLTLRLMERNDRYCFEHLFINKAASAVYKYDSSYVAKCPSTSSITEQGEDGLLVGLSKRQQQLIRLYKVVKAALTDRISHLVVKAAGSTPWSITSEAYHQQQPVEITLNIQHNPGKCFRSVDYGPSADEKDAAASYRAFWAEKAELRRFQDGRILECVAWTGSPQASILHQIIGFAVRHHLGMSIFDQYHSMTVPLLGILGSDDQESTLSLIPLGSASAALDDLETTIRTIGGLPLQIRQIRGYSPLLCFSSQLATTRNQQRQPIHVSVQFEGSTRWPNDYATIQRTKIAFLLKLGELLEEAKSEMQCKIGLENDGTETGNLSFLDIRHPSQHLFRLRIHHERENPLLQGYLKDKAFELGRREKLISTLSVNKRYFEQGPLHTQAVRTLCTRYPLLSPCMRLLKTWRDNHLLSSHLSDELIELIVAQVSMHPEYWSTPGSLSSGFLRSLSFISKWDWRTQPLIVDFSASMSDEEYRSIHTRFNAWKEIDPAMNKMVMFAASNIDKDGLTWTETGPTRVAAARFTDLAKAACEIVGKQGADVNMLTLFTSPTSAFDFLLHIQPQYQRGRSQEFKESRFKNLQLVDEDGNDTIPVNGFVEELRSLYGHDVLFFYNDQKFDVIAGLWNPQTESRPWKVNLGYSSTPKASDVEEGDEQHNVSLNKSATLNDIARLGGDLIAAVEVHG